MGWTFTRYYLARPVHLDDGVVRILEAAYAVGRRHQVLQCATFVTTVSAQTTVCENAVYISMNPNRDNIKCAY